MKYKYKYKYFFQFSKLFFVDRREIVAEFSWNCCKATLDNGEHKECMLLSNYIVLTNNGNSIETWTSIFINIPQSGRYTTSSTGINYVFCVCPFYQIGWKQNVNFHSHFTFTPSVVFQNVEKKNTTNPTC